MDNSLNVLNFIKDFIAKRGYPPTVREVCQGLGFSSTSTAQYYIKKLQSRGILNLSEAKNRSITLNSTTETTDNVIFVPEVGTVTAGLPILAVENLVGYSPVPAEFGSADELFMLKISGTSMLGAGICDGDKIIVKKTSFCEDGDIIVALVDDSATCKRFFKKNGKIILHPENEAFSDIVLDEVNILGTVKGLIRKY